MCTAISFLANDHYFGRNLDLSYSYDEAVTITPRKKELPFRHMGTPLCQWAMIGTAYVVDDYPLYYDAVNERGLAMAGLNFPGNAYYRKAAAVANPTTDKHCVASFEMIPWVLGQCRSVREARALLAETVVVDTCFNAELLPAPLHWMLADRSGCLVAEPVRGEDGEAMLRLYDNPAGVLTNNPSFPFHLNNLNHYMQVSADPAVNLFSEALPLHACSAGMGGMGLPGDLSSESRFVRAAFGRAHAVAGASEQEAVNAMFHILGSVEFLKGSVRLAPYDRSCPGSLDHGEKAPSDCSCSESPDREVAAAENPARADDRYDYTIYTACCNTDKGIYYYRTYDNSQITAVDLHREDLLSDKLAIYPMRKGVNMRYDN